MDLALTYLNDALGKEGGFLVIGDRDVDGVSSSALIASFLYRQAGQNRTDVMLSDDGDDYGLTGSFLERALSHSADLLIILDMGSAHMHAIKQLTEAGKKVIVLDHHTIPDGGTVPDGCAFVNPHLAEEGMYCHDGKIATVGLAFKLVLAFGLSRTRFYNTIEYIYHEKENCYLTFYAGAYNGSCRSIDEVRAKATDTGCEILDIETMPGVKTQSHWKDYLDRPYVAARLLFAAHLKLRPRLYESVLSYIDFAAIGLITDMVPLVEENRAIVRCFLWAARTGRTDFLSPGMIALTSAMKIRLKKISSKDLGWSIGPALNAAGRMGNTTAALELLLSKDIEEAGKLATALKNINEQRKSRTKRNEKIIEEIKSQPERAGKNLLFLYDQRLEPGVSGIIASRLVESEAKTVIYISPDGRYAKGSVRTMPGVNALELLKPCEDLLVQFGGHPEAAGFTVDFDQIGELQKLMLSLPESVFHKSASTDVQQKAHMDLHPSQLNTALLHELDLMEPFGPGNPEVKFRVTGEITERRPVSNGKHIRFRLQGMPRHCEIIQWNTKVTEIRPGLTVEVIGSFERNHFPAFAPMRLRADSVIVLTGAETSTIHSEKEEADYNPRQGGLLAGSSLL